MQEMQKKEAGGWRLEAGGRKLGQNLAGPLCGHNFQNPRASGLQRTGSSLRPARRGFTLTELLIVIAIIAVLASLITAAAINALRNGKRAQILLEIKQMSAALEDFKNDYGAYPPNANNDGTHNKPGGGVTQKQTEDDFIRMFKRAFPRMDPQELVVLKGLAGRTKPFNPSLPANMVTSDQLFGGLNAEEGIYFWLSGFSDDPQFPLSGPGGPSFIDNDLPADEILENRKRRYEFDFGRLIPRVKGGALDGTFDTTVGRSIEYTIVINATAQKRRINLWEYVPKGSEKPFAYFDVSRYKPAKYDPPAELDNDVAARVYAIKRFRQGVTTSTNMSDVAFVNAGKFQILHAGLDDTWGANFGGSASSTASPGPVNNPSSLILFPDGPFVGDAADTLSNFTDGPLADAQENK